MKKILVNVKNISKSFGGLKVVEDISLNVYRGEVACIVGPSGCGKSTLLRIIGDLEGQTSGEVERDYSRKAFIFQEPRLIPWFTVKGNINIVLKNKIRSRKTREDIIREVLNIVHLNGFEDYYPDQLSGGMKQRVTIARAISIKPDILLMDEPLANIDFPLRMILICLLDEILSKDIGGIFITHDTREAVLICDKVSILTNIPSRVKKTYEINRPKRERSLEDIEFVELANEMTALLIEEVKNHV